MKLSLIMATVGRKEEVGRLIQSLIDQSDHNFELIVVDQNLDDRLLPIIQIAQSSGLEIQHLRLSPPNLSLARNLGILSAQYEILGFPDDDCWYEPTVIEGVRNRFIFRPELGGAVACWIEQTIKLGLAQTGRLSYNAWRQFRGGQASSISLFFRRELFNMLGGFDDRLGVGRWYGAGEETDFLLRALAANVQLEHAPEIRVHHNFSTEQHGDWPTICRNARNRARGAGAIYAKHRLNIYIVIRGLLSPFILPILKLYRPKYVLQGWFIAEGRLEGFMRWKLKEKNATKVNSENCR